MGLNLKFNKGTSMRTNNEYYTSTTSNLNDDFLASDPYDNDGDEDYEEFRYLQPNHKCHKPKSRSKVKSKGLEFSNTNAQNSEIGYTPSRYSLEDYESPRYIYL